MNADESAGRLPLRSLQTFVPAQDKTISGLKKKNQELEKLKFVLDFQLSELKKRTEPQQDEIGEKKERIQQVCVKHFTEVDVTQEISRCVGKSRVKVVLTVTRRFRSPTAGGRAGANQREQHSAEARRLGPEAQTEDQRQGDAQGDAEGQLVHSNADRADTAARSLFRSMSREVVEFFPSLPADYSRCSHSTKR